MFERKMTDAKITEAKNFFREWPELSCKDVADTIGVDKKTLKKYLEDECKEANKRGLLQRKKVEEGSL